MFSLIAKRLGNNTFALSGASLKSNKAFEKFSTKWVTKNQITELNLAIKSDAKPMTYHFKHDDSGKSLECYRLEDLENSAALEKCLDKQHVSVSSGIPYRGKTLCTLIRASLDRGFESNLWFTKDLAERKETAIKAGATPVMVAIGEKHVELFNGDQVEDVAKIQGAYAEREQVPKSARTGGEFRGDAREALEHAAANEPGFSSYWLTRSQAQKFDVTINEGAIGVQSDFDGKEFEFFNASQTSDPDRVVQIAQQNRKTYFKSWRNRQSN